MKRAPSIKGQAEKRAVHVIFDEQQHRTVRVESRGLLAYLGWLTERLEGDD